MPEENQEENKKTNFYLDLPEFDYSKLWSYDDTITEKEMETAKKMTHPVVNETIKDYTKIKEYFRRINEYLDLDIENYRGVIEKLEKINKKLN
ncbi:hypothetical protein NUSPORA_01360 [Nucleospora cyclopteri]